MAWIDQEASLISVIAIGFLLLCTIISLTALVLLLRKNLALWQTLKSASLPIPRSISYWPIRQRPTSRCSVIKDEEDGLFVNDLESNGQRVSASISVPVLTVEVEDRSMKEVQADDLQSPRDPMLIFASPSCSEPRSNRTPDDKPETKVRSSIGSVMSEAADATLDCPEGLKSEAYTVVDIRRKRSSRRPTSVVTQRPDAGLATGLGSEEKTNLDVQVPDDVFTSKPDCSNAANANVEDPRTEVDGLANSGPSEAPASRLRSPSNVPNSAYTEVDLRAKRNSRSCTSS